MKCPLCGGNCQIIANSESNAIEFKCIQFNRSFKVGSSVEVFRDDEKQNRINNLIFEHVIRKPYADENETYWRFFYEPTYKVSEVDGFQYINVAEISYPRSLTDKIDRILMNLYGINPNYGYCYIVEPYYARAFFAENKYEEESLGIVSVMLELGYIHKVEENGYKISAKGWQRIDECFRNNFDSRQAFIAMAFSEETRIIREAFKKGIGEAGFRSVAIDEKEHNNQIVPEIFAEIDRSSFLVMDATIPNNGAYYEAGYAIGRGKQVIVCCRSDSFRNESKNRPHFDIAQKSMVIWDSEDELVEKLKKRIIATVH